MNETYNLCYKNPSQAFCEDVYFFKETGDIVFYRSARPRKINNIFSIMSSSEQKFLKDRLRYNGSGMIFVANSSEGPVIFNFSFTKFYKTFIAIIPHFDLDESLTFISSGLLRKIYMSDEIKALLLDHKAGEIKSEHKILAHRISSFYFANRESRIGITNEEIQTIAHEIAIIVQDFCGCDLELRLTKTHEEDLLNAFCIDSYVFALTCYCFVARNHSADRKAIVNFIFDQYGFCFDFSFMPAHQYQGMKIYDFATEMQYFKYRADPLSFIFYVATGENSYDIRTFTWQRELLYYGLKQKSHDDDDEFEYGLDTFNLDILK